mgnify:CR=1 FL=1
MWYIHYVARLKHMSHLNGSNDITIKSKVMMRKMMRTKKKLQLLHRLEYLLSSSLLLENQDRTHQDRCPEASRPTSRILTVDSKTH